MEYRANPTTFLILFTTLLLLTLPAQAQTPPDTARVNAGGSEYTTGDGQTFDADDGSFFSAGSATYSVSMDIQSTDADLLYQTERYSADGFSFAAPMANGFYDVTLSFAETFIGVAEGNPVAECADDDANETDGPNECEGERVFDVVVEGDTLLQNYDIYVEAGRDSLTAVDTTLTGVAIDDDGLNIEFVSLDGQDNPKLSAISALYTQVIPVELASFEAAADGRNALLSWETLTETNNEQFEVLHKGAGETSFEKIGSREGAGTTAEPQRYSFKVSDLQPGTHAFRLRQVDVGGAQTLSDPVSITIRADAFALKSLSANPFRSSTSVRLTVQEPQQVRLELYNMLGQNVRTLYDGEVSASRSFTIEAGGLSSGQYFLRAVGEQAVVTQKLVLVR